MPDGNLHASASMLVGWLPWPISSFHCCLQKTWKNWCDVSVSYCWSNVLDAVWASLVWKQENRSSPKNSPEGFSELIQQSWIPTFWISQGQSKWSETAGSGAAACKYPRWNSTYMCHVWREQNAFWPIMHKISTKDYRTGVIDRLKVLPQKCHWLYNNIVDAVLTPHV